MDQVTKIYELRTLGYDDVFADLTNIDKAFAQIKKIKLDLQRQKFAIEDTAELEAIKKKLQELSVEEGNLRIKKQELTNEAKAGQVVRQAEISQRNQEKQSVQATAGSYAELYKQYKDLYALVKNAPKGSSITFQGNTLQYDQAIAKLKELSTAEQDFRRQFQRDQLLVGEYTSGIIQAFKQLGLDDLIGGQITRSQARLQELNGSFNLLKQELSEIRVAGNDSFEGIEQQLIANRNEALALQKQIGTLQAEFRGTGDVGNQITSSLASGFKNVRTQIGQVVLGYIGFQAAFNGIIQGIDITKDLSDQTTNLEIELGKTAEGAQTLVDQLAKLDTRTKLTVLEDIANIAVKAGTGEQNLISVTQAIDKIKTAFGKDFGDVETGTESLVKIINIFEGAGNVTGENLLKAGNAIRTLANESVASVPYLNDFTKRMAGLKGISDISLPSVLGLASGFEQFGQSAEVSSTALVRIIPQLANDTQKYAEIAGLTVEQFRKVLNENPAEALVKVSEGLVKGKKDIEEISAAFADSELGKGRVSSVLGVLGKNADAFRKSMDSASESFKSTTNIEEAFTAKNENLAGTLDKISKKFADAANSKAFQLTLTAIAAVITFLITNLPAILILGGLLAASWALQNANLVLLNAQMLAYNLLIIRNYALLGLLTIATALNKVAMLLLNGAVSLVTKGFQLLGIAIKGTPFGIILTVLGTLAGLFIGLSRALAAGTAQLTAHNRELALSKDIHQEAALAIADQAAKVQAYAQIVRDATISEQTRLKALQDLIAINPAFSATLKNNKIDLDALNATQKDYNANLLKTAELQAAQNRQQKEFQDLVQLQNTKQGLEIAKAQGKGFGDLTDDERAAFSKITTSVGRTAFTSDLFNVSIKQSDFDQAFKDLDAKIKTQQDNIDAANNVLKEKYLAVNDTIKKGNAAIEKNNNTKPRTIQFLQDSIKDLNDQIAVTEVGTQKLKDLLKQRQALQDELDAALEKGNKSNRGSRISGEARDALRDIDALRDEQLAEENLFHQKGMDSEENYLRQILDINQAAIDKKLSIIKGANPAERKLVAELQLQRITEEMDTNDKIFQLREKALKFQLDLAVRAAQLQAKLVEEDPTAAASAKAQAKLDSDKTILALYQKFNADIIALQKQLGVEEIKDARETADAISKINDELRKDERAKLQALLKDVQDAGNRSVSEFQSLMSGQKTKVATNDNLSQPQKDDALQVLNREENIGVLAREVASLRIQLPIYKKLLAEKQITDQQYNDFITNLNNKEQKLAEVMESTWERRFKRVTDFQSLLAAAGSQLLGLDPGSNADKALAEGIKQTYSTLQGVMNDYFNAEEQRIQRSLALKNEQIDIEQKQVEARAQSGAEIASLDKQFADKRKKAQQDALNQTKKLKRAEAAVAFATELANIWSTVFQYGPIAGAILGALLSGLALVRYQQQVQTINSQQAAYGMNIGADTSTTRGGKVGGRSHSRGGNPFLFQGRVFEDEVDELNIIRTKNAPANKQFTISGNQTQIASALNEIGGGIRFAPGANVMRYGMGGTITARKKFDSGGYVGASLQAPVFSSINAHGSTNAGSGSLDGKFDKLAATFQQLAIEQSNRIDRLEVYQVTSSVTTAQKKRVKQSKIASI